MEITRRDDIGDDLKAPLAARGGVDTPGYALVGAVEAGGIVIHYDSAAEHIVGVSRATGEQFNQPIWWAARGSYARKAGVEPEWLPGLTVGLEGYRPLAEPLALNVIRQRREALFALRDALQAEHQGQSLYFPWIPYQDSLRTFQTYLAKFPRAALAILPEVAAAVAEFDGEIATSATAQPEIAEAERDIATAAGRPRPPRESKGQGFAVDQRVKVAVETHAMNAALAYFSALGEVTDTSRNHSYDYVVRLDGADWHVEVKGTTGSAEEILLTPNEVKHADECPHLALFVLAQIKVSRTDSGEVNVSGGQRFLYHPWSLDPDRLTPIGYKYGLPDPPPAAPSSSMPSSATSTRS
jgi:hypothetical protein